jgi:hypothetical protein
MKITKPSVEEVTKSSIKNCLVLVNAILGLAFMHYFVYLSSTLIAWIF